MTARRRDVQPSTTSPGKQQPARTYRELHAWQGAMALAGSVYRITSTFPKSELCSLTSQMRRAAVSVPSNIAEGAARGTNREFRQFLLIARGSLSELETESLLARDFGYIQEEDDLERALGRLFRLLSALIKSTDATDTRQAKAPA